MGDAGINRNDEIHRGRESGRPIEIVASIDAYKALGIRQGRDLFFAVALLQGEPHDIANIEQ